MWHHERRRRGFAQLPVQMDGWSAETEYRSRQGLDNHRQPKLSFWARCQLRDPLRLLVLPGDLEDTEPSPESPFAAFPGYSHFVSWALKDLSRSSLVQ